MNQFFKKELNNKQTNSRNKPTSNIQTQNQLFQQVSTSAKQKHERQRIIEQNIKLKLQIHELSSQLEQLIMKDRKRKRQFQQMNQKEVGSEQNEQIAIEKRQRVKRQKLQILQLKNKTFSLKRQLQSVYNSRNLFKKQQQLKKIREQIQRLQAQRQCLHSLKSKRESQMQKASKQQEHQEKFQEVKKQLSQIKQQHRVVNQKVTESQRVLRKNHEQFIKKQEKVRELQQKLLRHKERSREHRPMQTVTSEMILELEGEIAQLEQERRQTEKLWHEKVKAIDEEYSSKKNEQHKKLLIFKQKERQYKLNQLRIKQLRKLVRHNMAHKKAATQIAQDQDMTQFRNKRNIKYLQ